LLHIGRQRRASWGDLSGPIPRLESEAQVRLQRLAERWGWREADSARMQRAWAIWTVRR
jgi:hypothetical protein